MNEFIELWWILPASVLFSTIAVGSGVSGALFFRSSLAGWPRSEMGDRPAARVGNRAVSPVRGSPDVEGPDRRVHPDLPPLHEPG
jgi:hypothetical protein